MYPQVFGKYVLERELARGGMARVLLATLRGADGFEKKLVVKQIRDELACDDEFVSRFVLEAKTTVNLAHPNIVPVYELGVERGPYFLGHGVRRGRQPRRAPSRVAGPASRARARERRRQRKQRDLAPGLSPDEVAYVGVEVCRALDYAAPAHERRAPGRDAAQRDGRRRGSGQGHRLRHRGARRHRVERARRLRLAWAHAPRADGSQGAHPRGRRVRRRRPPDGAVERKGPLSSQESRRDRSLDALASSQAERRRRKAAPTRRRDRERDVPRPHGSPAAGRRPRARPSPVPGRRRAGRPRAAPGRSRSRPPSAPGPATHRTPADLAATAVSANRHAGGHEDVRRQRRRPFDPADGALAVVAGSDPRDLDPTHRVETSGIRCRANPTRVRAHPHTVASLPRRRPRESDTVAIEPLEAAMRRDAAAPRRSLALFGAGTVGAGALTIAAFFLGRAATTPTQAASLAPQASLAVPAAASRAEAQAPTTPHAIPVPSPSFSPSSAPSSSASAVAASAGRARAARTPRQWHVRRRRRGGARGLPRARDPGPGAAHGGLLVPPHRRIEGRDPDASRRRPGNPARGFYRRGALDPNATPLKRVCRRVPRTGRHVLARSSRHARFLRSRPTLLQ